MALRRPAVAGLLIAVLLAAWLLLPVQGWLLSAVEALRALGAVGPALFVPAYVLACVLLLPGSVLTLGAGFLYGPVAGLGLASLSSVLGASAAFGISRTRARSWVVKKLVHQPRFAAIDRAVGQQGLRVVLLLRLSPVIPFNLLNYGLGLTRVRFRDYLAASWLGMLPGTLLYVYLGSVMTSVAELGAGRRPDAGPFGAILFWGGLAATLGVTVWLTRLSRKALREVLA
ncbi:MAG TPA: TVP38/TMEM64 family protein [Myxococcaceae bacterium]|nr:TVP38/TMEM64 family protein [Myxococcaceae bacterium]